MMEKILVTGSLGQIGSELVDKLRGMYGNDNVIASDLMKKDEQIELIEAGPFELLDVMDGEAILNVVKKHGIKRIVNLAALLSAVGEKNPHKCWQINMGGVVNCLEIAKDHGLSVFTPSSIACFGPTTPKDKTPQETVQRPNTMYGVTKVAGELICDYYHSKFGVDTRGVRFPGLISYKTLPGGGTTDYAVEIYYEAIKKGSYDSFIDANTYMDMMYMPDAIDAIVHLMNADPSRLRYRNAYNITAMSINPLDIEKSIKKFMPDFKLGFNVDPVREAIAQSWPNSLDDSPAREDWDFSPKYDLDKMTEDMLKNLMIKLDIK
mgnify:CR=1 FL=1